MTYAGGCPGSGSMGTLSAWLLALCRHAAIVLSGACAAKRTGRAYAFIMAQASRSSQKGLFSEVWIIGQYQALQYLVMGRGLQLCLCLLSLAGPTARSSSFCGV